MEILLSAGEIQKRVAEIAGDIRRDVPGRVHFVAVLKGAFVFLADLIRQMPGEVTVDFIALSSYGSRTTSSGDVRMLKDLDMPLLGRDVVVVEDVIDSGTTLAALLEALRGRDPQTLRTVCLLNKPARRRIAVPIEYVGFTIGDRFVVGYGLDSAERYRHLPYLAALETGDCRV